MSSNVQHENLTGKQEALIAALLSHKTIEAAAREVGISVKTAGRWRKLPAFQASLKAAQHQKFNETLELLRSGVSTALATLHRHMTDPNTRAYVQVMAAQVWLSTAIDLHKMEVLEQKVSELEHLLKERS
jgi:hypothetical protein